jgi:hypothetical protein
MTSIVYDGQKLDLEALFMHSATRHQFFKDGRIEYREMDGGLPFFVAHDPEFPGKMIVVSDHLEPGKVFRRTSPPVITEDDFRFVPGEPGDRPDGESPVTVYCDRLKIRKVFEKKHADNKELVFGWFRRDFEHRHSDYLPVDTETEIQSL